MRKVHIILSMVCFLISATNALALKEPPPETMYEVIPVELDTYKAKFFLDAENNSSPGQLIVETIGDWNGCGAQPAVWKTSGQVQIIGIPAGFCGFRACSAAVNENGPGVVGLAFNPPNPPQIFLWRRGEFVALPSEFSFPENYHCGQIPPSPGINYLTGRGAQIITISSFGHDFEIVGRLRLGDGTIVPAVRNGTGEIHPVTTQDNRGNNYVINSAVAINGSKILLLATLNNTRVALVGEADPTRDRWGPSRFPALRFPPQDDYPDNIIYGPFLSSNGEVVRYAPSGCFMVLEPNMVPQKNCFPNWGYNDASDFNNNRQVIGSGSINTGDNSWYHSLFIYNTRSKVIKEINNFIYNNPSSVRYYTDPITGQRRRIETRKYNIVKVHQINSVPGSIMATARIDGISSLVLLKPKLVPSNGVTTSTIPAMDLE